MTGLKGRNTNTIFESENINYIRPSTDLIPEYLEMVNDIENVARFIGNIEFFNRGDDSAEWGIVITEKMQDKGYGKEALKRSVEYGFNDLGLSRIFLGVYADNPRAIHVYEQCGFKEYDRNEVDVYMEITRC